MFSKCQRRLSSAAKTQWVFNPRTLLHTKPESGQMTQERTALGGTRRGAIGGCGFLKYMMTQRVPQDSPHYIIVQFGLKHSEANPQVKGFSKWLETHSEIRTEHPSRQCDCNTDQQVRRPTMHGGLTNGVQGKVGEEHAASRNTRSFLHRKPDGWVMRYRVL